MAPLPTTRTGEESGEEKIVLAIVDKFWFFGLFVFQNYVIQTRNKKYFAPAQEYADLESSFGWK